MDSPVGVGFSEVGDASIPASKEEEIEQLIQAVNSLTELHPGFKRRPVIVVGQSYGAVPALEMARRRSHVSLHIVGLVLAAPRLDLQVELQHLSEAYYQFGLLTLTQSMQVATDVGAVEADVQKGYWKKAWRRRLALLEKLRRMAGVHTDADPRRKSFYPVAEVRYQLQQSNVRKALNVTSNVSWMSLSKDVFWAIGPDYLKPQTDIHQVYTCMYVCMHMHRRVYTHV